MCLASLTATTGIVSFGCTPSPLATVRFSKVFCEKVSWPRVRSVRRTLISEWESWVRWVKVLLCRVRVQERAVSCSEMRVSEKSEERVTWFEEKSRVASA
jgi:hypothetical protein